MATETTQPQKKRFYVPNTYIIQCHDMLLPEIWAQLGSLDLQFLRLISLGQDSSRYNHLAVFGSEFQNRLKGKASAVKTWTDVVGGGRGGRGGRGRGGRGRGRAEEVAAPVVEEVVTPPLPESPAPVVEDGTPQEIVVQTAAKTFTLRPFFVSAEFESKTPEGYTIIPHIVVMYPKTMQTTSTKLKDWVSKALECFVSAGILQPDSYSLVTQVLDPSHLKRNDTPDAFIRFKSTVPVEARNAVYAILRRSLWYFSLRSDEYDLSVIQATIPFQVACKWKISRNAGGEHRPPRPHTSS